MSEPTQRPADRATALLSPFERFDLYADEGRYDLDDLDSDDDSAFAVDDEDYGDHTP